MSEVRVHVRLGTLRLDFQGEQAFYEAHIEALVAAAAIRGASGGVGGARSGRALQAVGFPSSAGLESPPAPAAPPASAVAAPVGPDGRATPGPTTGTADPYTPSSPEFGRFLRRLGVEADAPDRQILAFAFYLWNYERLETFGLAEIAGCLGAIGRELPADAAAVVAELTDGRRFLEAAGPGRWRLAKRGENYVKTRLLTV